MVHKHLPQSVAVGGGGVGVGEAGPAPAGALFCGLALKDHMSLRNVFGQPLAACGEPGHSRGSWDGEMKCSEQGGGVHQVCTRMNDKTNTFSTLTGQSDWSRSRHGQNHCLCLGAYALHAAKVGPALDLKCEAIPDIALTPRYVRHWSTWNGLELPRQIEEGVHRLVTECTRQANTDEHKAHLHGLACGMVAAGHMAAPPGVDCDSVEAEAVPEVSTLEVGRLRDEYGAIFGPGGKFPHAQNNRNVGGHLWAAHILDHAPQHTEAELRSLFSEFCPVSGSPVSPGRPAYPFRHDQPGAALEATDNGDTGVHHCCRPCICDLQDGARTAPLDVEVKGGETTTLTALALRRNPCKGRPDGDQGVPGAPAVHCTGGHLTGARTVEVDGEALPVIGILQGGLEGTAAHAQTADDYCAARRQTGYRGGMGMMFRRVATEGGEAP